MTIAYIDDPMWLCEHPEIPVRHPKLRLHTDCDGCQRAVDILLRSGLISEHIKVRSTSPPLDGLPILKYLGAGES